MNLITRHDLAKSAADRWWLAYLSEHAANRAGPLRREAIHANLKSLGPTPTPDQVDAVMPNKSRTRLTCSCCYKEAERVVAIDVTAGEYETHICERCARKAAELFT